MQIRKGQKVMVTGESGKSIQCPVVDVDFKTDKIWVRLPTDKVMPMRWNYGEEAYVGSFAGVEFMVYPDE